MPNIEKTFAPSLDQNIKDWFAPLQNVGVTNLLGSQKGNLLTNRIEAIVDSLVTRWQKDFQQKQSFSVTDKIHYSKTQNNS